MTDTTTSAAAAAVARTTTAPAGPGPGTADRTAPSAAPGAPDALGSLGSLGLFTLLVGAALPLIDFFIVNVALPTIDHDLAAGPALLELVVAGYGVAYAVLLVLGGRLGDRFGRRRLFAAGMAAFGLTSLACGLAPDAWSLVGARVAQGAAAALMLPQVLATIQAATHGTRKARAIGLYGATAGLAMVAGQILGGVLVSADLAGTGWRAIFLVNVPVAGLGLLLARTVPETRSASPAPVDVPGTLLLALALTTLLVPLAEGRTVGWPLWTWVALALWPFATAGFFLAERHADRAGKVPLVPPSLLRLVSLRRGLALVLPFSVGFGGFMFVAAVALQQGLRLGPVDAGLALAPMAVAFFLASLAGPRLVARYGTRVVTVGGLLQGAGLALLVATAWHGWPDLDVLDLAPAVALAGLGQGLQLPVLFRVVLADVPADRAGVGSGVMVTSQQSALALGVATLGSLFLALVPAYGMRTALAAVLVCQLGLVAVTVALSLRLPRRLT
ncbi:MFS transporter [Streptomyces sp. NPDC093225]|uniref:MFS transporter n=1 Tax=Streptomyces sp. NPDC093225 TaxID=3366034 RepID=UPI0037FF5E9B